MKRIQWFGLLMMLFCAVIFAASGLAQVEVFFSERAMDSEQAHLLMEMTQSRFPQTEWSCEMQEETGRSLKERILSDDMPEIVVCTPNEANVWVKEGLFEALDACAGDLTAVEKQVISACTENEKLYMAPLFARHRQMAVNRRLLERRHFDYMTSRVEHPIWYPMEFDQILEEFALTKSPAVEIWMPEPENCAALEALYQSIYAGTLLTEDGRHSQAGNINLRAGLEWLRDRVKNGMIGVAESREQALEHFLNGETALFIDWTEEEERRYAAKLRENGIELMTVPYPTSSGFTIRAFELTGVCVSVGLDAKTRAEAFRTTAFWCTDERVQKIFGGRGIFQDDAIWLPLQDANTVGMTLRSLMCEAVRAILSGESTPQEALKLVCASMDALP